MSKMLAGHHALIVFQALTLLVVVNHSDVFGHVFKLVGQTLTLNFGKDASLVVIPTNKIQVLNEEAEFYSSFVLFCVVYHIYVLVSGSVHVLVEKTI